MSIDRIENGFAVLEKDGDTEIVPIEKLPPGSREGSVLERRGEIFVLDEHARRAKAEQIRAKMERLRKN